MSAAKTLLPFSINARGGNRMRHEETKCDVREEGWERDVTDTGGKDRNKDISANCSEYDQNLLELFNIFISRHGYLLIYFIIYTCDGKNYNP
jgi:hypothetical protein